MQRSSHPLFVQVTRLYNKEVDGFLRRSLVKLRAVYDEYSCRFRKPGEPAWQSVDEFLDVLDKAEVITSEADQQQAQYAFIDSQMFEVDEMATEDQKRASFVEFLEAACRAADYISGVHVELDEEAGEVPLAQRLPLVLHAVCRLAPMGTGSDDEFDLDEVLGKPRRTLSEFDPTARALG